jgi:ribose 5-phosphate isomerase B
MKIFIGSDHRGFYIKQFLKDFLFKQGYEVEDCGNYIYDEDDDYPDFAFKVAEEVSKNNLSRGILICGSGAGVCFSANKVKGIRASLAFNEKMASDLRKDDDVNILCLASDFIDNNLAEKIVLIFLNTDFMGEERYLRRIQKVQNYENRNNSFN